MLVLVNASLQIICLTDVYPTTVAMQHVDPKGHFSTSSKAAAAAVSASCFEAPVAEASPALPKLTVTVKRGAWCGPLRSVIV